jgi:hypothetical protein
LGDETESDEQNPEDIISDDGQEEEQGLQGENKHFGGQEKKEKPGSKGISALKAALALNKGKAIFHKFNAK